MPNLRTSTLSQCATLPHICPSLLNRGSGVPISVKYATKNGTAVAGSDFKGVSGILEFPKVW